MTQVETHPPRGHRDLRVWQDAMSLVTAIYSVTATFPAAEQFGLTAQLRRASVSVPSNIAEGAARVSKREFAQYLSIARGSLAEVETQLLIAQNLHYLSESEELLATVTGLMRSLTALMRTVTE